MKIEASSEFAEDWRGYEERIRESQDKILWPAVTRFLPKTKPLIACDLGCGTGRLTEMIAEITVDRVYGIDVNRDLLDEARKRKNPKIVLKECDLSNCPIPLENESCDLVFSNCLLLHLPLHSICPALEEISRILKSDGKLVISLTHYKWAKDRYKISKTLEHEFVTVRQVGRGVLYEYFRTAEWYTETLKSTGFQVDAATIAVIPDTGISTTRYKDASGEALFSVFSATKSR